MSQGNQKSKRRNFDQKRNFHQNHSNANNDNQSFPEVQIIQDPPSTTFSTVKVPVVWALPVDLDYQRSKGPPPGWNYNPSQGQPPRIPWNNNYQELPEWNQPFIPQYNQNSSKIWAKSNQQEFNNNNSSTKYGFGSNNNNYSNSQKKKDKKGNKNRNIWNNDDDDENDE